MSVMSNKERAFEKKMADAAEKAKKKEESDIKKAEKLEKEMRNIQHRKAVYDAANAANIPHNMIYYTRTKNVNAIVNAAARKLTAKKKKEEKEAKGPAPGNILRTLKAEAAARGYTNKEIGRITSKMTINEVTKAANARREKELKALIKKEEQEEIKRVAEERGINVAHIKYKGKKTLNEQLANAAKRANTKRATNERTAKKAHIIQLLANSGFTLNNAGRITSKMSNQEILNSAKKRFNARTSKQSKNQRKSDIIRAVLDQGYNQANIRYIPKNTLEEHIAKAKKRFNTRTAKQSRNQHKENIIRAALEQGYNKGNVRYIAKKSRNEIIANAKKRFNKRSKSQSREQQKSEIAHKSGYSYDNIKHLFCKKTGSPIRGRSPARERSPSRSSRSYKSPRLPNSPLI